MLDFEKNDYEIHEKGTNFWGEKRYELIEKPKGPGCFAVVFGLIIFLVSLFSNDETETNDELPLDTEPTQSIPARKVNTKQSLEEDKQEVSNPFGNGDYNMGGSQGNASYHNSIIHTRG
mgnify:CR=1 FL=1